MFLLNKTYFYPPQAIGLLVGRFFVDQVGHFDKFISLAFRRGDQRIQHLRGVFGSVVAENDGAVAQMLVIADFVDDRDGIIVLPVQAVHILNTWIQLILEALQYMDKKSGAQIKECTNLDGAGIILKNRNENAKRGGILCQY